MSYRPKKTNGAAIGILLGAVLFGFIIWGIGYSLGPDDRTLKILLYIPTYLFLVGYLFALLGAFMLAYEVHESGLIIRWGLRVIQIKWEEINNVIKVEGHSNLFSILGVSWPGYIAGLYSVKALGTVRMYATSTQDGFIYLKTQKGFFGITPCDDKLIEIIAERAQKPIEKINMDIIKPEVKGKSLREDRYYNILYKLNFILLLLFALYLAICFPGSGAPRYTVLLLVLAVALFFFNVGNAGRLYQFSETGGYAMMIIGIIVTGIFIILSFAVISL